MVSVVIISRTTKGVLERIHAPEDDEMGACGDDYDGYEFLNKSRSERRKRETMIANTGGLRREARAYACGRGREVAQGLAPRGHRGSTHATDLRCT
ncbi:MAG: hypothetical protein G01um101477_591 [Candidatus Doudnabacteria bacterium Gr01-1014_77]|uniref:Uncharacterized protein n=1 Tax=Candidatus Doudnabacteria bacterium Gr01-1014_77 TaxID=2017133 RepID=A0A554J9Y5_9BACT|nr:MAG: hypothetical protein G01um101477_591 [Candidatus Doudnabacteria bacterium Gr01-1014_77]